MPRDLLPLVVAGALCAGCGPERQVIAFPALPEDATRAALVLEDATGGFVSGTALLRVEGGRVEAELPADDGAAVILLAFREQDLPTEAQQDPARFQGVVRPASPEEPLIPPPHLAARAALEPNARFEVVSSVPDLTAAWAAPCRTFESASPEARIHPSCVTTNCTPSATQNACVVRADLGGACGLGTMELRLRPEGRVDVLSAAATLGTCAPTEPRAEGELALSCDRPQDPACRIDFFPPDARIPLEVSRLKLVEQAEELYTGAFPAAGPALLSQRELVVAVAQRQQCLTGDENRLVFVDRASLSVTRTATTPLCLRLLGKDPSGDGLVGLTRGPVEAVRFDADGRLLARRAVELAASDPELDPQIWGWHPSGQSAAVWITTRVGRLERQHYFVELRWSDLSTLGVTVRPGAAAFPVALTASAFVLVDDDTDTLRYFDRVGGAELAAVSLTGESLTNRSYWSMMRLGDTERLLLFINSPRDSISLVEASRTFRRMVGNELTQSPYSGAPLPGHGGRLLIGSGHPSGRAELVVFDPDGGYFLPGRVDLGVQDLPGGATSDGLDPHVFFLMRDSTFLVRVRAAE